MNKSHTLFKKSLRASFLSCCPRLGAGFYAPHWHLVGGGVSMVHPFCLGGLKTGSFGSARPSYSS